MSPLAGLKPGFADPVRQAQQVFRVIMNATARPATAVPLSIGIDAPEPLGPTAAALLLALTDFETSIWLDGPLAHAKDAVDFITFHTGARLTRSCAEADFAVIAHPTGMPPLRAFSQGTPEYPDRSTTIILQIERLKEEGLTLAGPGILGTIGFSAAPLPGDFAAQLALNRTHFPCGVDLIFASATHIAALPRSVRSAREA